MDKIHIYFVENNPYHLKFFAEIVSERVGELGGVEIQTHLVADLKTKMSILDKNILGSGNKTIVIADFYLSSLQGTGEVIYQRLREKGFDGPFILFTDLFYNEQSFFLGEDIIDPHFYICKEKSWKLLKKICLEIIKNFKDPGDIK